MTIHAAGTRDVIMLGFTGERERSRAKLGALFERPGFALQRVVPADGPVQVVEACAT